MAAGLHARRLLGAVWVQPISTPVSGGSLELSPRGESWSGARDLNPGPHGPELLSNCIQESPERLISVRKLSADRVRWHLIQGCFRAALLHERLHEPQHV